MSKDEFDFSKLFTRRELKEISRRAIIEAKFIRGEYSSIGQMVLEAYGPAIGPEVSVPDSDACQESLITASSGDQQEAI